MKKHKTRTKLLISWSAAALMCCIFVLPSILPTAYAADPVLDLNNSAFKLVVCDGPENLGRVDEKGSVNLKLKPDGKSYMYDVKEGYIPCNFKGAMMQVQHLINVMTIVGVFAAIAMFCWAGGLYITGKPANITKAHAIFPKVFGGFIIMLSAWFIVYQVLSWLTATNSPFSALLIK